MSIMNQNPLLSRISVPDNNNQMRAQSFSPQEWEYIQTMRRTGGWQDFPQNYQQNISDPYTDFENEFNKCSSVIQNKIINSEEFKDSMRICDEIMQRYIESIVRPQIMQTGEGRIAFEKLLAVFRGLKEKYSKEEIINMEKFHKIMQDEVVQKRLAEIEKGEDLVGK